MMIFKRLSIVILLGFIFSFTVKCQKVIVEIHRFLIENAVHLQGVAVDRDFFYAISNSTITKHRKSDGSMVEIWDGREEGIIKTPEQWSGYKE